ncbi:MAG: hypothetical protein Q8Q09_00085 [Deltaproteobacteria bacterium]|nr:hypothetical protein [Deltaproteobacteria bacterium]
MITHHPLASPNKNTWGPAPVVGPLVSTTKSWSQSSPRSLSASHEARSIEHDATYAWIEELYRRVAESKPHAAMDLLLQQFDDWFDARRFSDVDYVLRTIDLDKLDTTLQLGLLGFTKVARDQLHARAALLTRVEERLRGTDPQRCERLLARVR